MSSKDKFKDKLVPELKETTKPPSVTDMLVENGLTGQDYFEVLPQEPYPIFPSKAAASPGIPV